MQQDHVDRLARNRRQHALHMIEQTLRSEPRAAQAELPADHLDRTKRAWHVERTLRQNFMR